MASKQILCEQSAQSTFCKKSVHVRELVRRLLNTNRRLDWNSTTARILTEYMGRMLIGGYDERYRRSCLGHALRIYDIGWYWMLWKEEDLYTAHKIGIKKKEE
jgi:hypothetical protein